MILAIISATGLAQAQPNGSGGWRPLAGGAYRGAILLSSPSDRQTIIKALTNIGFVRLANDGTLQPALAKSWQVSDDRKTLTLQLVDQLPAPTALKILKSQTSTGYWDDADMTAPDPHSLRFQLSKPWAGFVTELVTPIFGFGPYRLDSAHTKTDQLVFDANAEALTRPYLKQVDLRLYTDPAELQRSLRRGGFDGAYLGAPSDGGSVAAPRGWQSFTSQLPDQYQVFLNLRQDSLKDRTVRQHLINFDQFDQPLSLHMAVPDSPQLQAIASDLVGRWAEKNVAVQIDTYPILSFTDAILAKHNYDLVLLGIDYGPDGDLYPYWDSSQIAAPGLNLAGYRNQAVDKLLDQARQEPDMTKRHDLFGQAQKLISDDAASFSVSSPRVAFIRSPKIKGPIPATFSLADSRWTILAQWYTRQRRG